MEVFKIQIERDTFNEICKLGKWTRIVKLDSSVKSKSRVYVYEVIRKKKMYTGSIVECVIDKIETGSEVGINPLTSKVHIRVVGKIQLGIQSSM